MVKKMVYTLIALAVVAVLLAACASLPIPGISAAQASSNQSQSSQRGFNVDPSKMPVEQKLGIGILKLEGTPQAITPAQAKQMLPLWQAVKSLSTSSNTSPAEITALYQQIQAILTPDQVQAIQKMTWTQAELQTTMKQYGIQFANNFGRNGSSTLDPSARATRIAQFQAQGGGNGGGGGGGNFGSGGGGGFGGGGTGGTTAQRTPVPGGQGRRAGGGLNYLFANAVIKLLTQKAGA